MENLFTEFRLALRRLAHARLVTLLALLTLALGIGANSAIFTVVNAVLLRPLPFAQSEQLVRVYRVRDNGDTTPLSAPAFLGFRDRNRVFESLAVYDNIEPTLTGSGDPQRVRGLSVSDGFFEAYRVRPLLGRTLTRTDNEEGAARVVVLSEELWRTRFGADPQIVGKPIMLNSRSTMVVGVTPTRFGKTMQAGLFTPITYGVDFRDPSNFYAHYLAAVARLKPGITLTAAQRDIKRVYEALKVDYKQPNPKSNVTVLPMHTQLVKDVRTPLYVLLGAVGLVLLIACANLANLLLANAASRWSEFAVRRSLGASSGRLIRQVLIESSVLGMTGGVLGLLAGAWGAALLTRMLPESSARLAEITIDGRVLAFTAGVSVLAALLFGLAPALQVARTQPARTLRESGRGGIGSLRGNRMRSSLVVAETALAVMLLVGAGLLLRSFASLQRVDPGFEPQHVLTFDLSLPSAQYPRSEQLDLFYSNLLTRLGTMPGVTATGATFLLPLGGGNMRITWKEAGTPDAPPGQENVIGVRIATPGYFRAMGIPLLRGRLLTEERKGSPIKVLISEAAAQRYFPNKNALGKNIELGWVQDGVTIGGEVVGIVGSVRQSALDKEAEPELYVNYAQLPDNSMTVVTRTTGEPTDVINAIRQIVREQDPALAMSNMRTLESVVDESLAPRKYYTLLIGVFAAVAMLLAALGIFGVISVMVSQRRSEIGVRVALGAAPESILRMVIGNALRLVSIGLVLGLAAAFALTRVVASLLFNVEPTDPFTFVGSALVLLLAGLAASALPAWNAARVDPLVALRS
jgi:putative ABC transport system permease protein